ncbi:uncharacterized protein METZ01_LOCUS231635 [marine metagenome]|jgi:hypothetical protein|uniref:Uncharacterized protein n=1 Tax=marine metagenome TaxID=408172 RepID=A0A382GX62_9ZZZZ
MTRARTMAQHIGADGMMSENEDVFEEDLTVDANNNMVLAGPVTIPNITINGNLNVIQVLNITTEMNIGANGSLNMVG